MYQRGEVLESPGLRLSRCAAPGCERDDQRRAGERAGPEPGRGPLAQQQRAKRGRGERHQAADDARVHRVDVTHREPEQQRPAEGQAAAAGRSARPGGSSLHNVRGIPIPRDGAAYLIAIHVRGVCLTGDPRYLLGDGRSRSRRSTEDPADCRCRRSHRVACTLAPVRRKERRRINEAGAADQARQDIREVLVRIDTRETARAEDRAGDRGALTASTPRDGSSCESGPANMQPLDNALSSGR
jgi:hypothetical protein